MQWEDPPCCLQPELRRGLRLVRYAASRSFGSLPTTAGIARDAVNTASFAAEDGLRTQARDLRNGPSHRYRVNSPAFMGGPKVLSKREQFYGGLVR